jgi:hypothetical protein
MPADDYPLNATPPRQIRALYDDKTVRVYQAYADAVADAALARGTFVSPPFKMSRMTWIKPSFLWMMHRSDWGQRSPNQARILAIDISREGFEWALAHSCASHRSRSLSPEEWQRIKENSPVRIQWDPERNLLLQPQPHLTIQIGLGKQAACHYVNEWIRHITDVTSLAHNVHALVKVSDFGGARRIMPTELEYQSCSNRNNPVHRPSPFTITGQ